MTEAETRGGGVWLIVLVAVLAVGGQAVAALYLMAPAADSPPAVASSPTLPVTAQPTPASLPPAPEPNAVPTAVPEPVPEPEPEPEPAVDPPAQLSTIQHELRRRRDGGLAQDQDLTLAQTDLERALAAAPEDPDVLGLLAEVVLAQGEPGGALPFARRAAAAAPEDPRLQLLLAECLVSLGQAEQAEPALSFTLLWTKARPDGASRLLRARALMQSARGRIQEEKFEDALALLEEAREASPAPLAWVEFYTGYVYQRLRAHLRGLPHYTTALRLDPSLGDGYYFRATLQFDLGAYPEALADLERALELHEQGVPHRYAIHSPYYVLGRTLEKMGRWQGAYDAFERYLREAPVGEVGASGQHAQEAMIRLAARLGPPAPR